MFPCTNDNFNGDTETLVFFLRPFVRSTNIITDITGQRQIVNGMYIAGYRLLLSRQAHCFTFTACYCSTSRIYRSKKDLAADHIAWTWRLTKTSTGPDRPTDLHTVEIIRWLMNLNVINKWKKHLFSKNCWDPKGELGLCSCQLISLSPQCFQAHGKPRKFFWSKILDTSPHTICVMGIWPFKLPSGKLW